MGRIRSIRNQAGESPYLGCMLAHELSAIHVDYPAAVEDKLDGIRITFVDGRGYTRNGKTYDSLKPFADALLELVGPGVHVDTEMCGRNWNDSSKLLKRINDVDHEAIKEHVTAYVFDMYSADVIKRAVPYESRRKEVVRLVRELRGVGSGHKFEAVKAEVVSTPEEIDDALKDALQRGREGVMVKSLSGVYVCKRSRNWMKLKPFKDITLTIIGFEEAKGKCSLCMTLEAKRRRYERKCGKPPGKLKIDELEKLVPGPRKNCVGCDGLGEVTRPDFLGAFLCKDSKGNDVKVGGGFTQEQRVEFWVKRRKLVGRKIDVKVQDEKANDIVARFPVFQRIRDDL